jgi:type 1 glutamine amidotransferase
MRSTFVLLLIAALAGYGLNAQPSEKDALKNKHILLFTRNGKGYVHENIPFSIAAIQKLGKDNSFIVDTTPDPAYFNDDALKIYDAIIFSNTNNEVFDTEQQKVSFMRYVQAGGGFMGIHSASGTERNWKWFKLMLGATFMRHPPFQPLTIHVLDHKHEAVRNLPITWETKDECYLFKEFNPNINVLLVTDLSKVKETDSSNNIIPDVFGNMYPAAWCQEFDGGKVWYTALGHSKEDYENPVYLAHLTEGLKWVTDKGKLNYKKAYATSSVIDETKLF